MINCLQIYIFNIEGINSYRNVEFRKEIYIKQIFKIGYDSVCFLCIIFKGNFYFFFLRLQENNLKVEKKFYIKVELIESKMFYIIFM